MASILNNQKPSEPLASVKRKRWILWIIGFVVIIVVSFLIYFYALVRQNVDDIESGNSNSPTSSQIATEDDPYIGNPDASIVIVEFSDYGCPYCYQSFPVIRELADYYGDKIKIIYRDFPLKGSHPNAQKAAEAGECAQEQGKFWAMHDKMFINHDDLSVPSLKKYAQEIEMDTAIFNDCLDSDSFKDEVENDFSDGFFLGVDGTPTFFINGYIFQGAATLESFRAAIDPLIEIYYTDT